MPRLVPACLVAAAAVASVAAFPGLSAQNPPKRPSISADTNSAYAYYRYGMNVVAKQPQAAADAFYWASQIDPTWAQPFYARRIALLLAAQDPFVIGYMEGSRSVTRSREAARIDSLELRARMLNPFLNHELDMDLLQRYLEAEFRFAEHGDATNLAEFRYYVDVYWRTEAPPYMRAFLAASERRYPDALKYYAQALGRNKQAVGEIHLARGQIFFMTGRQDSALVEVQAALDNLRKRDRKDFVYLYESKGVLEHGVGLICETQGRLDEAREAYGRALQEDLSYYPAHVHLALLALASGDTATAQSEMELAAQIREDDPWVQTTFGAVLAQLGHLMEADQHLRRAVELAPYYAAPFYALGRVAEATGKPTDAAQYYRAFLAHTWAQDTRAAEARQRLSALEAAAPPDR